MGRCSCDYRYLLLLAGLPFIYIQMRLFTTQSEYADRLTDAIEAENQCTRQTRLLIDQISMQRGQILSLEEEKKRRDQECIQLRALVQDLQRKGVQKLVGDVQAPVAAVVVMACNRADYLDRTIKSILKYQSPVASKYPLFISQDGPDPHVKSKAMSYDQLTYMQHLDYEPVHTERPGEMIAYYKISRHYKWALDQLFYKHKFSRVIILEDDMEIAPDFFDYFEAGAALMDHDKSIMAISSWNDNGQKQFVHDPYVLYRSDFFPGLGWMLSRSTWDELSPKWPKAYPSRIIFLDRAITYWDDWLRLKENHKGRQFIRPEVCRTYNFGEHGSSMGQFFKQYLEPIKLNDVQVDWKSMDLSYLEEDKYVEHFGELVRKATPIQGSDAVLKASNINGDVRILYGDQRDFERVASQFGIFEEWKDGVPRAAYKGVVVFRYHSQKRVFLVAPDSLQQLGISGSSSTVGVSEKFWAAGDDASGSPGPAGQMLPHPNLRVFSLLELKAATRNFRHDSVLGEGGFGKVYKGWLDTKSSASGSGTQVAVKKLHSESMQGFQEWQSEVNFLGRLSHPNLVKLLGYGWEEKELLLVYEYMPKGSLENHLFGRGASVHPLPWDTRLKILIGAANGLAFLHALDRKVIYRDFKASNILLDGSYHAKISDFGLAKWGPTESCSHVTTQVMGTYGYAAPEYVATGRLYVKSDVYGFGVVLVEMLTGMRALDTNRPSGQHNLVEWIKPHLSERRRLKHLMDVRLEGRYPKSVLQFAQLALNCLEQEPKNRPSMQEIVETLERIGSSNDRPRKRKLCSVSCEVVFVIVSVVKKEERANLSSEGYSDLLSEHPSGVYFGRAGLGSRAVVVSSVQANFPTVDSPVAKINEDGEIAEAALELPQYSK
ncbi:hypothetical protein C2S52_005752 [Perilla frutescens var. hirtella]|nr:hypothetical protein C2S52_005752 [Perilla frutescens var. hirtella]